MEKAVPQTEAVTIFPINLVAKTHQRCRRMRSLKGSSSNKKKVFRKKRTASVGGNKPEDGPRSKKKTTSNKYISVEEGERIKETLKTFIKSVHTHCEKKLRDDKSLSIFLVRKQFVHFIQNIEPSCTLFGNVCRDMLTEIISKFTEVAGMKVKNCEKAGVIFHTMLSSPS